MNGFHVLLSVPAAPEVLAEIKRTIYSAFCPFLLRLEFSHYMTFKIKFTITWLSHSIFFHIRKGNKIDRPEAIGVVKGGSGPVALLIEMPPMIKRMTTKPIIYSVSLSFSIFAYKSN